MNVHFDLAVPGDGDNDGAGPSPAELARCLGNRAINEAERYAAAILVEEHRFGQLIRSLGSPDYYRLARRHLRSRVAQREFAGRMGAALRELGEAAGVDERAFVRVGCETMRIVTAAQVRVGRHYRELMARN